MSWISPRSVRCLALVCLAGALWAGCGRFGFDALGDDSVLGRPPGAPSSIDSDAESASAGAAADAGSDASTNGSDGATPPDVPEAGATDAGSLPEGGAVLDASGLASDDCGLVPSALACANFNDRNVPAGMTLETSGGSVDLSQGYVLASVDGNGQSAFVAATFAPVTSGSVYLRLSMRIPQSADLSSVNFAEIAERDASDSTGIDFNFWQDDFEVHSHQTSEEWLCSGSGCSAPRDEWFCFNAQIDLGNSDGRVRTWLEGSLLQDVADIDTLPPGGVGHAAVGINWTAASQGAASLVVDDFAVSTSPLTGCP